MNRNRICAWCVTSLTTLTIGIAITTNAVALNFMLVESGEGANASVTLWVRGIGDMFPLDAQQLVAPSGDVFDTQSGLESGVFGLRLRSFDTLEDASNYMNGSWHATIVKRFIPREIGVFDFMINDISAATIDRTLPTLLSPSPGKVIKNGSTFLFSWDYLGTDVASLKFLYHLL